MTQFIIGKACTDVSERLRKKLIEDIQIHNRAIIIVPDQYEYETEKALYRACAAKGDPALFSRISVLTFSKLSDEIIAKYSGGKKPADDTTKNILMYRAVSEIRDELRAFGKIALKPGFAPRMTGTIALLKTSGVSAAGFSQTIEAVSEDFRDACPALFAKLGDISMIYTAYDALLSKSYSDKLDVTAAAARLSAEHGFFCGEHIYCDGFSDFSKSQLELLFSAVAAAEDTTFSFTSDNSEGCRDIFTTVNNTISLLAECAERNGKTVSGHDIVLSENDRFTADSLAALSECIFSEGNANCAMDGVRIICADDVSDETDMTAAEIHRLITEEGLRCSEIAVLCADPASYRTELESSFEKYEIPLFCDIPESILHLPLVNYVLSLLNVMRSFSVENVLSYVKTGFIQKSDGKPLTMRDINDLENFIYEWDLKGESLKEPFLEVDGKTPRAEEIRADIVPPLLDLRERIKSCTGDQITKEICDFMFDVTGVQRAVAAHCKASGSELLSDSDKSLVSSYQTLWNTLLEIFESLYKGLEGYKISPDEYYDLFRDICSSTTLSKPPQTLDAVLAGDIVRTRISSAKAVFIIGAAYGVFPSEEHNSGVFSEYEAELLSESIIKLGMTRKERYCYDRYLAFRALSLPSERLYITYPLLDISCAKVSPSDVVSGILGIFGKDKPESTHELGEEFFCRTKRAAQQRYASLCHSDTTQHATLKKALEKAGCGEFTAKLDRLVSGRASAYLHKLDPETSEALFRTKTFSATKLERLNHCRFEYFCTNGLRIKERSRRNLSSMEIGSAVHYILQKVLEKYCARMDVFITLSRKNLSDEAGYYLNEYKNIKLGGDYAKTLRFAYLFKNLITGAVDILILLQSEFAARDYRPKFFELSIGGENTAVSPESSDSRLDIGAVPDAVLSDNGVLSYSETPQVNAEDPNLAGSSRTRLNTSPLTVSVRSDLSVSITGVIDRADIFTDEHGNEYIRVVDYKTGSREFSMVNVYYGINTQMLLYLIAVCSANKELRPGGVSYLPARVTEPSSKRSAAFTLLATDHIQSGMYIASDAASAEMNKYAQIMSAKSGAKPEKFIPKEENTLSEQQFEQLTLDMLEQTRDVVGKLYSGDVDAVPTVYKEKSVEKKACSYCRFENICGHREDVQVQVKPRETISNEKETDNNEVDD
ncbi:MAG: PD-(D/E)XK nuclease family protein [Oscillospiraceae bacterium]